MNLNETFSAFRDTNYPVTTPPIEELKHEESNFDLPFDKTPVRSIYSTD